MLKQPSEPGQGAGGADGEDEQALQSADDGLSPRRRRSAGPRAGAAGDGPGGVVAAQFAQQGAEDEVDSQPPAGVPQLDRQRRMIRQRRGETDGRRRNTEDQRRTTPDKPFGGQDRKQVQDGEGRLLAGEVIEQSDEQEKRSGSGGGEPRGGTVTRHPTGLTGVARRSRLQ